MTGGPEHLDHEYASGGWDYLEGAQELPRFGVVSAYCQAFARGGRILELGCGTGVLAERLDASRLGAYRGVDISATAIEQARTRVPDERFAFEAADIATYAPAGPYDAIVFNEVLEYLDDPRATVARYWEAAAPEGVVIVSQYLSPTVTRTRRIWRMLEPDHATLAQATVSTRRDLTWIIKVLRPAGSPSARA